MRLCRVDLEDRGYIRSLGHAESPAEEMERERRQKAKKKRPVKRKKKR